MFINAVFVMGLIFGIALCFVVIPYKLFFTLTKSPFIDGLISSIFYGYLLAILTVYLWYISAIILLIIGFCLMGKTENPKAKKVIMGVFVVLAIVISIIGINIRKDSKNSQDEQDEAYQEYNEDYDEDENYDEDTEYNAAEENYASNDENTDIVNSDDLDSSYDYDELGDENNDSDGDESDQNNQDGISEELTQIEETAQELQNKLQNDSLSNSEMLQVSAELYELWDDELNMLWARLKNTLDSDSMDRLTKEERAWIKEKEQKIKEAGSELESASEQSLVENTEGADLTRERVYELAEYLK